MKYVLSLLFWLCVASLQAQSIPQNPNLTDKDGKRQGKWTILYDKDWNIVFDTSKVEFYRTITYQDDKPTGIVKDHYKNGIVQMEATLLADRPRGVMDGLVVFYDAQGKKEKEAIYKNGKLESEKSFLDPNSWKALNEKGLTLYQAGKYQEVQDCFEKAKTQAEKEFGSQHQNYATALNNLAFMYDLQGNYATAAPLYEQALEIRRKVLGEMHPDFASSLNNLALLYKNQGDYQKAAPLYEQALEIRRKVLGEMDPDFASSLNNLARLYELQGDYQKAEPLYAQALEILRKALGEMHPDFASSLNNLAGLYESQGDYPKAAPFYEQALEIRRKALGEMHPDFAMSLNNLGFLYNKQGDYRKAEPLYEQALEIRRKALGEMHPAFALSLNNLAFVYDIQGDYQKAEPLYQQALEIRRKVLGEMHPDFANSLNNLAFVYDTKGDYTKAEPLYQQALEVRRKALGEMHPDFALSLNNLAGLYKAQGDYTKAELLYQQALEIRSKTLGEMHPDFAVSLNNLAILYHKQGDYRKAEPLYQQASYVLIGQNERNFSNLSEKEKGLFLKTFNYNFEIYNSFALHSPNPALSGWLYDNTLATKGLLFSSSDKIRRKIIESGDQKLQQLYQQWKTQKKFLGAAYGLSVEEREKKGIDLNQLETQANEIEKQLSAKAAQLNIPGFESKKKDWKAIQSRLKTGEAAIELIRFRFYDKKWTDSVFYMALIIQADTRQQPDRVILNQGNLIETKFLNFYRNSIEHHVEDNLSYEHFWSPIAKKLTGIRRIYFCPDGVYHSINLATLRNPQTKKYLSQEVQISLTGSTWDIVTPKPQYPLTSAVLIGYPDYNGTIDQKKLEAEYKTEIGKIGIAKRFYDGEDISELPGTKAEIIAIGAIMQKTALKHKTLLGKAATEDTLKSLKNTRIIHISTHGFFNPDLEPIYEGQRGEMGFKPSDAAYQNPLLQSGLLLSGAKQALTSGGSGVLTAYEAQGLDMEGTELVVMSACQTGLGEVKNGEGVYGLQRAMLTAGAQCVIMSLWKVDDQATQQFMVAFYQNWLTKKQTKRQAFLNAQTELRKKYPHPYYWGAFVLVGE